MAAHKHTELSSDRIEPRLCTLSRRLEVLRSTPFFKELREEDIQEVSGLCREKAFQPGQPITVAGDRATHLYIAATGKIKLLRTTAAGRNVVVEVITPGNFFGTVSALGSEEYSETAVAHTHCCVLTLAAADFQKVLRRYPGVALAALGIVAARLRELHDTVEKLSAHSAEQRIAATLLKLAEKIGEQRDGTLVIQMPLSHQDLADMAGTTRETASRTLTRFRKAGLIRTGRHWIGVLDPLRLGEETPA
ncbi:MAG TPA: Crp/Fnr family transcriptional regulator [Bryobacteraceae bacterium]|nr:Crp/Fnr family transcriptional regulator [Bryobacteraceae bacterium]